MPTQNTNSLLQSADTDLLQTADVVGKIYDGSEYINVDNERDKISLKPKAITKVENSDTTYVTERTDESGNTAYKVNVIVPTYTGEEPVVVNNATKKISVNKLPMEIKEPLHATVTPEKISLGCNIENYYTYSHYYDGPIATASITTGDNTKVTEIWNYSDLSAGELIAGTLFVEGFMYATQGYSPSVDELTVTLYFEDDDDDIQHIIYKDIKKIDAPRINIGSIIIPFTLHYSDTLASSHTKVRLKIKSSSNVFLSTTANVYFDGYRKQAIV